MASSRVLTVLGMHRSGTSCLVEGLESAGVAACVSGDPHLGPLREHLDIMLLNDSVLNHSSGSWADPPKQITWTEEHRTARDRLIERHRPSSGVWVFKDPRTLLMLEFWQEAIPEIELVGIVRSPMAVAKSLTKHLGKLPVERGLSLWHAYNRRLLDYQKRSAFPLLTFDSGDGFLRGFGSLLAAMKLTPARDGFDFFAPNKVHNDVWQAAPVPDEIDQLWRALRSIALC